MQFSFEQDAALGGSIAFVVFAILVIVGVLFSSYNSYKHDLRWYDSSLKIVRKRVQEASRRDREAAQSDLDAHLQDKPKKPSLKKRTFAMIGGALVAYLVVAWLVFLNSGVSLQIEAASPSQAYEAQYGVVENLQYDIVQLEPFVSTTTEGRTFLGSGSVDSYPESYVMVVYEYEDTAYSVPVALNDAEIIEKAGASPTIEFEIDDRYTGVRWAEIRREYEGCTLVVRWIWLTCDQTLVSETIVIDNDTPSLSELVAEGRVSVTMVMSPEQHREVLAGK